MLKLLNHNIILPKYLEIVKKKGSSLIFSASGGWDKEKKQDSGFSIFDLVEEAFDYVSTIVQLYIQEPDFFYFLKKL